MINLFISTLLLVSSSQAKMFNILSIDSAMYKGLISASFLDFFESFAYNIGRSDYCIKERESEKIALTEMFDMIAGSETGAIIASSLVIKDEKG